MEGGVDKQGGQRCQAKAKSTKLQCRLPAVGAKRVFSMTGPRSEQGRERCRAAKLIHGRETRQIRKERRQKLAELKQLEQLARTADLLG